MRNTQHPNNDQVLGVGLTRYVTMLSITAHPRWGVNEKQVNCITGADECAPPP